MKELKLLCLHVMCPLIIPEDRYHASDTCLQSVPPIPLHVLLNKLQFLIKMMVQRSGELHNLETGEMV